MPRRNHADSAEMSGRGPSGAPPCRARGSGVSRLTWVVEILPLADGAAPFDRARSDVPEGHGRPLGGRYHVGNAETPSPALDADIWHPDFVAASPPRCRNVKASCRPRLAEHAVLVPSVAILVLALTVQAWADAAERAPLAASSVPAFLTHPTPDVRPWPPDPPRHPLTGSPHGRSKTDTLSEPNPLITKVPSEYARA